MQPLLDEAMDMKLLTAGSFEDRKETKKSEDGEVDSDDSVDEDNYAKRYLELNQLMLLQCQRTPMEGKWNEKQNLLDF